MKIYLLVIFLFCFSTTLLNAQTFIPNYDESKVPAFELPDPLILLNGNEVKDIEVWENERRPEIIDLFETYVYGKAPSNHLNISFRKISEDTKALEGKAARKEVVISITSNDKTIELNLLIYLPNNGTRTHPIFLGLNFYGNHSIHSDSGITLSTNWIKNNEAFGVFKNIATEASRGVRNYRWPVEYILDRGYGLATMYYGDIDPDFDDGFQNGVHPLFNKVGQTKLEVNEWGSIAAWSWGLSRAMDYFETDNSIDNKSVVLMGHSRIGKAALWGGALDERFAIVIGNNSGCGGAALSRRHFGETIQKINSDFPHWFCENFKEYNDDENSLPIDQHMLISLIAPRPVYITSAEDDLWADPNGEFLSAKYAGSVYNLYGLKGLEVDEMSEINNPIMNTIGYHVRNGKHDVTNYDWEQFVDFADIYFRKNNKSK